MGLNPYAGVFIPGQKFVKSKVAYELEDDRPVFGDAFTATNMTLHAANAKLERIKSDGGVSKSNIKGPLEEEQRVACESEQVKIEHEELEFDDMFHREEEHEDVRTPRVRSSVVLFGSNCAGCSMIQCALLSYTLHRLPQ